MERGRVVIGVRGGCVVEEWPNGSELFALAGAMLSKGFCGQRIEFAVVDICLQGTIPVLGVKFVEPGTKLPEFLFGKSGNF